jgi:hypothetical protein
MRQAARAAAQEVPTGAVVQALTPDARVGRAAQKLAQQSTVPGRSLKQELDYFLLGAVTVFLRVAVPVIDAVDHAARGIGKAAVSAGKFIVGASG